MTTLTLIIWVLFVLYMLVYIFNIVQYFDNNIIDESQNSKENGLADLLVNTTLAIFTVFFVLLCFGISSAIIYDIYNINILNSGGEEYSVTLLWLLAGIIGIGFLGIIGLFINSTINIRFKNNNSNNSSIIFFMIAHIVSVISSILGIVSFYLSHL